MAHVRHQASAAHHWTCGVCDGAGAGVAGARPGAVPGPGAAGTDVVGARLGTAGPKAAGGEAEGVERL